MLTLAHGKSELMDRKKRDRDIMIIDRWRHKLNETDAIWSLVVGDIGMIKR